MVQDRFYKTIADLWAQALTPFVPGAATAESIAVWDKRAASYGRTTTGGTEKSQACLRALQDVGLLNRWFTAIEYGSGTGELAAALAPLMKSYHCVDISKEMLKIVMEKCKAHGITNVTSECCDFWKYDKPRADLVITSYNPAVYCAEGVRQLVEQAVYGGAFICSCGPRTDALRDELCGELGVAGNLQGNNDAVYPYAVLHALGTDPVLTTAPADSLRILTAAEAEHHWISFLGGRQGLRSDWKETVRRHVERHLDADGNYTHRRTESHGVIVWHGKRQFLP